MEIIMKPQPNHPEHQFVKDLIKDSIVKMNLIDKKHFGRPPSMVAHQHMRVLINFLSKSEFEYLCIKDLRLINTHAAQIDNIHKQCLLEEIKYE
jgi:hypothetical protein